jgi:hypothetical protein
MLVLRDLLALPGRSDTLQLRCCHLCCRSYGPERSWPRRCAGPPWESGSGWTNCEVDAEQHDPINEDEAALHESGLHCVCLEGNGSLDRHSEASDRGEHCIEPPGSLEVASDSQACPEERKEGYRSADNGVDQGLPGRLGRRIGRGSRWVASYSVGHEDAGDDQSEAKIASSTAPRSVFKV